MISLNHFAFNRFKRPIFVVLILLFISGVYFGLTHFKVRKIIISTASICCGLEVFKGKNTLLIQTMNISEHLLRMNPTLSTVSMTVVFPDTIMLTAVEREPVAIIRKGEYTVPVDHEGIILKNNENDSTVLPILDIANTPIHVGPRADWRIQKGLDYIEELTRFGFTPQIIYFENVQSVYEVKLTTEETIHLPYSLDAATAVSSLQGIISRFRIEGKHVSKVDLRYDQPIVILKETL